MPDNTVCQLSEQNFQLRQEIQNLQEALYELQNKFEFLEKKCKESTTGVTVDSWKEYDDYSGNCVGRYFSVMWYHNLCGKSDSFLGALDNAMMRDKLVQT